MAAPTVFNAAVSNPGGTGSTITVTLSTHAVGDVLYIHIFNTGSTLWTGDPAGWTRIDQRTVGTSSTGIVGTWFYHTVVSGDSLPLTNPVFTLGATVTRAAICRTVRGSHLEGVIVHPEWGARGFATGTANPITPPTVTTLAPDMLVLHCYGSRTATNAPEPTSYTQDQEVIISGTLVCNASSRTIADQNTSLASQSASPTGGVRWAAGILCVPAADYPYYRSGSQATTASGTSVTPAKPTGTTHADVNGNKDVMIATVEGSGTTTLSAADSGLWTEVGGVWSGTTGGGGSSVKKFWCYATASPNMQFNRTGTGEISACITTYHNCNQTNPIGAFDADGRTSATNSTFDAVTRSAAKSLMQATCVADGVPTFTTQSGWIERMDGLGICCADQTYDAAGSTGAATFTLSVASPTLVGLLEIKGAVASANLTKTVSDTLNNWGDARLVGHGHKYADTINAWGDSLQLGLGHKYAETINNWGDDLTGDRKPQWKDTVTTDLQVSGGGGLTLNLSDTLNNWGDALRLGYGLIRSDEANALVDDLSGDLHNRWQDSLAKSLSGASQLNITASDSFTLTDGTATVSILSYDILVYGQDLNNWNDALAKTLAVSGALTLNLSDTLNNWNDSLRIGYGHKYADTVNAWGEALRLGYGLIVSDNANNWADALNKTLAGGAAITLQVSDAITWQDSLQIGYGLQVSDTQTLTDAFAKTLIPVQLNLSLADSFTLTDSFTKTLGTNVITLSLADTVVLTDAIRLGYGLKITDQVVLTDAFQKSMVSGSYVLDRITEIRSATIINEEVRIATIINEEVRIA